MQKFLVKTFIKDHENVKDPQVREKYGSLTGIVGICSNAVLCVMKILIGIITGSISILADGLNNLADGASSIITLVGFKLAARPADEDHPYGHARIEYITGLIISFLIIFLGIELLTSSIEKIRFPEPPEFSWLAVIILLIAIAIKVWQAFFNRSMGKAINSAAIMATAADSRNDVISTIVVLAGLLISFFTNVQLDGILGACVAAFIIYSGIMLIKETSAPLLGQTPEHELVQSIHDRVMDMDGVLGVHDLMVHDYGTGRIYASIHVEVDARGDLLKSHDMVDLVEKILSKELNIHLTCHMDPVDTQDPLLGEMSVKLKAILSDIPGVIGFHDLRTVPGYSHQNFIFDVVVQPDISIGESDLKKQIQEKVADIDPQYCTVITIESAYIKMNTQED
ncbi:MAG: cation diffusion facilitator family transporter [Firmicutes bacterium]|nr:cation diffusion facilitator family transporter [Bacillota bacterium]